MGANCGLSRRVGLASEIFEEYSDLIKGAIYSNINDYSKVDDVYQDLFLSLVHRPVPEHVDNVRAYLYRAVRHDIIDLAKKRCIYNKHLCKYSELMRPLSKGRTPLDHVSETEEFENFFAELEKYLSPHEAEAIEQIFRHGRAVSESAEYLGISRRSVSRYKCVALRKLRSVYRDAIGCRGFESV